MAFSYFATHTVLYSSGHISGFLGSTIISGEDAYLSLEGPRCLKIRVASWALRSPNEHSASLPHGCKCSCHHSCLFFWLFGYWEGRDWNNIWHAHAGQVWLPAELCLQATPQSNLPHLSRSYNWIWGSFTNALHLLQAKAALEQAEALVQQSRKKLPVQPQSSGRPLHPSVWPKAQVHP